PPGLAPLGVEARLAVAVALPAIQTVRTAPGASLHDFDLVDWRGHLEKLAIICQLRGAPMLAGVEGLRPNHLSAPIVMAVRLPVGSHVDELRISIFGEERRESLCKPRGAVSQKTEGDRLRERTIVKEN